MGFMIPEAEYFSKEEAAEYAVYEYADPEDRENAKAGWYARLSAPGYLDATDWYGPFNTSDEALAHVMDLYEVDGNGDPIEED